jgi:hypothetical protein
MGRLRKIAKSIYSFVMSVQPSVRPSVRPHRTNLLPPDGSSLNLIFEHFFENLSRKFKYH